MYQQQDGEKQEDRQNQRENRKWSVEVKDKECEKQRSHTTYRHTDTCMHTHGQTDMRAHAEIPIPTHADTQS